MWKGNWCRDGLQNGDQMGFRDRLATAHDLPLRERIDGIDVVDPWARGGVALMHRIDPQVAGPAARVGPPPLADGHRAGARPSVMDVVLAIDRAAPQVVDVRGRERSQSSVGGLAVDVVFAPQDAPHGRTRKPFVGRIDGGQQSDIVVCVAARKAMPAGRGELDNPRFGGSAGSAA